jgi:glycerate 2-kinase
VTRAGLAEAIYRHAVGACDPEQRTKAAVTARDDGGSPWVIAIGKAAHRMAAGAREALTASGRQLRGGLVVTVDGETAALPPFDVVAGDHPIPSARSARAAAMVGDFVRAVGDGQRVLVLISGGTSSLIAAPIPELSAKTLSDLFAALLRSGVSIQVMNAFRRRVLAWGGGRLALALSHAQVEVIVVSDVLGDDLAAIGSGPCAGDPTSATDLLVLARAHELQATLPRAVVLHLHAVERGEHAETAKPGSPSIARVRTEVIASNRDLVDAAATAAHQLGLARIVVADSAITGEACDAGAAFAASLLQRAGESPDGPCCLIAGGEPTVTIDENSYGSGGRCQEFALSAARELWRAGAGASGAVILAAGSDGRDGPTDAAGAIVDAASWQTIIDSGRDAARDLAGHDSYSSLDSATALIRTGPTGTNVNDLFVGLMLR